jgi:hypothetical protein
VAIGTAVLLMYLGAKSNLLRDLAPRQVADSASVPFSLARVQMAWWFFFIISAYLFLWLVFGEMNSLNATALTLLGISLSTGVVARTIDVGKMNRAKSLVDKRKKLQPGTPLVADKDTEARPPDIAVFAEEQKSNGFWNDILSDENGISLHRLQMLAWTLVLTAVFIVDLIKTRAMPVFDNTLLALMGISSGAFLGFKVPERQNIPSAGHDRAEPDKEPET